MYLIIGIIIGSIITFCICNPRRIQLIERNKSNENYNQNLINEIEQNELELIKYREEINSVNKEYEETSQRLLNFISDTDNKILIYEQEQRQLKEKQVELDIENYKKEFSDIKKDLVQSYLNKEKEMKISLEELQEKYDEEDKKLLDLSNIINATIEANKRAAEIKQKSDFYRLQISNIDIKEIHQLRTVEPYLRDSTPLNKIIYKYYYESAYTNLIGRIIGRNTTKTGIYKITNIDNGMCYVGQSKNIGERFRQHIKNGVGAEGTVKNKLYSAMKEEGVENFTFEILEECDQEQLDEREKFYIELYKCIEFG